MADFAARAKNLQKRLIEFNAAHSKIVNRIVAPAVGAAVFGAAQTVLSPYFATALGFTAHFQVYDTLGSLRNEGRLTPLGRAASNAVVVGALFSMMAGAIWSVANESYIKGEVAKEFAAAKKGDVVSIAGLPYKYASDKSFMVGTYTDRNVKIAVDRDGNPLYSTTIDVEGPRLRENFFVRGYTAYENKIYEGPTVPGLPRDRQSGEKPSLK